MTKFISKENLQTYHELIKPEIDKKLDKPENGIKGQVLTKTDNGTKWADTKEPDLSNYTTHTELENALKDKADIDGSYPDLSVGTAGNLLGSKERINSSAYRTSANDEDIDYGTAEIQSIKGNAIAWNQLVHNPSTLSGNKVGVGFSYSDGTWSVNGTVTTTNTSFIEFPLGGSIAGHKYLFMQNATQDSNLNGVDVWRIHCSNEATSPTNAKIYLERDAKIITATESVDAMKFMFAVYKDAVLNMKFSFKCFDLTLIYGAGNEPTTPEQFEADYQRWFGKPLEYEEYDEGSIRSVKATGIKTVGFNLCPVTEFEGTTAAWNKQILWKNYCGYQGRLHISLDATAVPSNPSDIIFAGVRAYYTDGSYGSTSITLSNSGNINYTTQNNKVVDYVQGTYGNSGTVKISNICINFSWSGNRDGDYEPHWEETKALPITTLTSNGEVVFPDGLKRAGNVYDEIYVENGVTKAIKRVGSVDLGSLNWTAKTNEKGKRFISKDINSLAKGVTTYNDIANILCGYYRAANANEVYGGLNKSVALMNGDEYLVLFNENFIDLDVADVKQHLQGVLLYYELAEPIIYTIDDFSLPLAYRIDDFGTEQILMPEDSVAPIITTKYGINAVDAIRRLNRSYISSRSADNLIEKLGGTKTWNEEKGIYEFDVNLDTCSCEDVDKKLEAKQDKLPDGTEGQVLVKTSTDVEWKTVDFSDIGDVIDKSELEKYLTKTEANNIFQTKGDYLVASDISDKADKATTLAGYDITDAKIENGVITLGSNTITPITSHQSLSEYAKTTDITITGIQVGGTAITPSNKVVNITVTTGDANGQVKIGEVNASVKGLGTAAYANSTSFATPADIKITSIKNGSTALTIGADKSVDLSQMFEAYTESEILAAIA